jgi:small subunit ribosomal protein S3
MGSKVHPKIFRIGITKTWGSTWFSKKQYREFLREDIMLREFLLKSLKEALIDRVEFERSRGNLNILIFTGKPGFIIGRSGAGIEDLKKKIMGKFYRGRRIDMNINVKEVKQISSSARIVGRQIANDIEKRMNFRRSMKQSIERVMKGGSKGVKVMISGRLNGAEIARTETLSRGKIPMHTLRADIDYAHVEASTTYGVIGVKVWINRGEVFEKKENKKA